MGSDGRVPDLALVGVVGGLGEGVTADADKQGGATIQDNRARSFALGPSLNYNAGPFSVSLSYQRGLYAANTTKNNVLGIGIAIPLWIKH